MSLSLTSLGRAALDVIYPPRCVLCDRHGDFLCAGCRATLPAADGPRCDACWLPVNPHTSCRRCVERPLALRHLRSVFRYEGDLHRLVHAFKFAYQSSLAPSLAAPMLDLWRAQAIDIDVVVPVPLTGRRRRERGFNQSALLARGVARGLGLPVGEDLIRLRSPGHQAEAGTAEQRRLNVIGAFAVRRNNDLAGRRVLLIDDIATTGSTLDACARAMLEAGAAEVSGLTLARED
jgi:ComF family protein